jgi:transitional endoplasmic reticulum ATPase
MKFSKGEIIAEKYEIKNFIEETSFCFIYSAMDKISSNFVSLYIYNAANIAKDDLDEENNFKEIEFLGLGVEGFPRLVGFGDFNYSNERFRYIATEFIIGESVTDRMKRKGPISQAEATIVGVKLVEIYDHLHNLNKSVLLNALSLDNIMFDMSEDSEKIKLRNLINVRYFEDEFKHEYIDGVIPNYLAPECFNNVFTAKSDQFNIASLMYHMISGLPPWFSEPQDFEINSDSIEILEHRRSSSLNFSTSFDEHIKAVISKALNYNAEERFISLQNFKTYLNRETILSSSGVGLAPKRKIKPKKTGNGFADVGGMEKLKDLLKSKIIKPLKDPEKAKKHGVTVPNGMLLYGPPGCGKTYIAKKFAEEAGYNFYFVKASDVSSIYVSGGEQKISELFVEAERNAPAIICFDEIDAVMPSRKGGGDSGSQSLNSRVNEYLSQIDNCSERGIFIIGTTNRRHLIDTAILRTGRLDFKIEVSLPDLEARKKIFEIHLKNKYIEVDIDYEELSNLTYGYTSSDIEFIVREAANKSYHLEVRISNQLIKDVISESSSVPSLSKKEIEKYSEKKPDNSSGSIGFKKNR